MSESLIRRGSLLALFAAILVMLRLVPTSDAGDPEPDVFVRTKLYTAPIRLVCGGDTCTGTLPPRFIFKIPESIGTVDVLVSLAIEYRTSAGDSLDVGLRFGDSTGPSSVVPPGVLTLRDGAMTTTTLQWIMRDVPGSAAQRALSWSPRPTHNDGDYRIRITSAVLSITAAPS